MKGYMDSLEIFCDTSTGISQGLRKISAKSVT